MEKLSFSAILLIVGEQRLMDTIQSRRFHRQGYLKVQRIIPLEMVEAARKIIFSRIGVLRTSAGASLKSGNVEALAEPSRLMGSAGGEEIFLDLLPIWYRCWVDFAQFSFIWERFLVFFPSISRPPYQMAHSI